MRIRQAELSLSAALVATLAACSPASSLDGSPFGMDVSLNTDSGGSLDQTTPPDAWIADATDASDAFDVSAVQLPNVTATAGAVATFATHAQLASLGFAWGLADGTMGAVSDGHGGYVFYGSALSSATCAGETTGVQGAYSLTGTLDQVTGSNGCVALFRKGDEPTGWIFDQDYAGGGQVLPFTSGAVHGLLMSFHAEIHWINSAASNGLCGGVPCFYGTLGLALSMDGGTSFSVVGEIIQPNQSIQTYQGGGTNMPVGYGSMVVADANGAHLPNPPPDPTMAYVYIFYEDQTAGAAGVCATAPCIAVARAVYADLVAAATSGDPARVAGAFHKYDSADPMPWSEAGTSGTTDQSANAGRFTPLWTDEGAQSPSVLYDSSIDAYLLTYAAHPTGSNGVVRVRASRDLLHWTASLLTYSEAGRTLMYPSLIGETGDPLTGGPTPRIYFSSFVTFPTWATSVFETLPIAVSSP